MHGGNRRFPKGPVSAHIRHFFDPKVLKRYKPDYVSPGEYKRRLENFPTRYALVKAAEISWQAPMEEPRKKFVRKTDDKLRNEFNEAVEQMQKVLPRIESVYQTLVSAEPSRDKESVPRCFKWLKQLPSNEDVPGVSCRLLNFKPTLSMKDRGITSRASWRITRQVRLITG